MSPQAQDLLRKIIVVDADKRATIDQITTHSWFIDTLDELYEKPKDANVKQMIDLTVVFTMTQAIPDWGAKNIIHALNTQRHNSMTATYYLLCDRHNNDKKPWILSE